MLKNGEDAGKNWMEITCVINPNMANSYHSKRLPAKQLKRIFFEDLVINLHIFIYYGLSVSYFCRIKNVTIHFPRKEKGGHGIKNFAQLGKKFLVLTVSLQN